MKIQYVGPYIQNDGWGNASYNFCKVLKNITDHDIKIASISLANYDQDIALCRQEEFKDINGIHNDADICIFNCFPNSYHNFPAWNDSYKIKMFFTETKNIQDTGWPDLCNEELDAVIVNTFQEKFNLIDSGVKIPIHVIPMAIDSDEILNHEYNNLFQDDKYNFYYIGDLGERKNLLALIRAYYIGFQNNKDVRLIIRANGISENFVNKIKQGLRLPGEYPELKLIPNYLSRKDLLDLHYSSDCFVMPSRGESVCIPLVESIIAGNKAIVTSGIGADEIGSNQLVRVRSREVRCECYQPPLEHLYTANQYWMEIDETHLFDSMLSMFDLRDEFYPPSNFKNIYTFDNVQDHLCPLIKSIQRAMIVSS